LLSVSGNSNPSLPRPPLKRPRGAPLLASFARSGIALSRERIPLRCQPIPAYDNPMAKAKKFELESHAPTLDEEDEETLVAIDEGILDAKAGRTVPAEEVRKRLPKWITASSTRKGR
jgi:hypothetical protein